MTPSLTTMTQARARSCLAQPYYMYFILLTCLIIIIIPIIIIIIIKFNYFPLPQCPRHACAAARPDMYYVFILFIMVLLLSLIFNYPPLPQCCAQPLSPNFPLPQ